MYVQIAQAMIYGKGIVFMATQIAWFGFNLHPGHIVASLNDCNFIFILTLARDCEETLLSLTQVVSFMMIIFTWWF